MISSLSRWQWTDSKLKCFSLFQYKPNHVPSSIHSFYIWLSSCQVTFKFYLTSSNSRKFSFYKGLFIIYFFKCTSYLPRSYNGTLGCVFPIIFATQLWAVARELLVCTVMSRGTTVSVFHRWAKCQLSDSEQLPLGGWSRPG